MKQALKPSQIVGFALALAKAKQAKSLTNDEFNSLHARFKFDDASGSAWTVGIHTRKWHRRDASGWVPDSPPETLYADVGLIGTLYALGIPREDVEKDKGQPVCTHCGVPIRPGKKFCVGCGEAVAASSAVAPPAQNCPRCGRPVAGKRFCGGCGSPV